MRKFLETEQVILAPIERFDETCVCLERRFPDSLTDCHYRSIRNKSVADQELDEATAALLRAELGEAEFELVELADQQLNLQLDEWLPDSQQRESALQAFRRRCQPKRGWRSIWRR